MTTEQAAKLRIPPLQAVFDVEDIGPEAELRSIGILLAQVLHDVRDLLVRYDGEYGLVHCRPGMVTVMRLPIGSTASCDIMPQSKAPLAVELKKLDDFLAVSLII